MLTIKTRITPKIHKKRVRFILPDIFSLQSISEKNASYRNTETRKKKIIVHFFYSLYPVDFFSLQQYTDLNGQLCKIGFCKICRNTEVLKNEKRLFLPHFNGSDFLVSVTLLPYTLCRESTKRHTLFVGRIFFPVSERLCRLRQYAHRSLAVGNHRSSCRLQPRFLEISVRLMPSQLPYDFHHGRRSPAFRNGSYRVYHRSDTVRFLRNAHRRYDYQNRRDLCSG